ncbi:MAG: hypothetical protein EAZ91_01380 [Cytophagales bacterium]|nr:MAG: hypothetical protein EAZ91_01380 [Cytophagales bacterium]
MKLAIKSVLLGLSIFAAFCALLIVSASAVEARPMSKEKKVITTTNHAAYVSGAGRAVSVNVEKPAGEALSVKFTNDHGNVLAEQFLTSKQSGTYGMSFNVEQLPDGVYHVRIVGKETDGKYTFTLKTPDTDVPARSLKVL